MLDRSLIRYTNHAKRQMQKRKITDKEVWQTLSTPDMVTPGSHSTETIAIKKIRGKRIRVIYISEPTEIRVITVTL